MSTRVTSSQAYDNGYRDGMAQWQPIEPTPEQIAAAIDAWWEGTYPRAVMLEEVEQLKSVVLALLRRGAADD